MRMSWWYSAIFIGTVQPWFSELRLTKPFGYPNIGQSPIPIPYWIGSIKVVLGEHMSTQIELSHNKSICGYDIFVCTSF